MKLLQHVLKNNRDYKYLHDEQAIFVFTEFFFFEVTAQKLRLRSYGSVARKFIQSFYDAKHFRMLGILCISDSF